MRPSRTKSRIYALMTALAVMTCLLPLREGVAGVRTGPLETRLPQLTQTVTRLLADLEALPPAPKAPGDHRPRLYALLLSADDWTQDQILGVLPDSKRLARLLGNAGNGLFASAEVTVLHNRELTLDRIGSELTRIQRTARAEDVFVLSLIGLPVVGSTDEKNFLFPPESIGKLRADGFGERVFVAAQLVNWLAAMRALNQMLVLDGHDNRQAFEDFRSQYELHRLREAGAISPNLLMIGGTGADGDLRFVGGADEFGGDGSPLLVGIIRALHSAAASQGDGIFLPEVLSSDFLAIPQLDKAPLYIRGVQFPLATGNGPEALSRARAQLYRAYDRARGGSNTAALKLSLASEPQALVRLTGKVQLADGMRLFFNGREAHTATDGAFTADIPLKDLSERVVGYAISDSGESASTEVNIGNFGKGLRGARHSGTDAPDESATGTPAQVRRGRDFALLIATNEYRYHKPLANPVADAQALATLLRRDFGFEVDLRQNLRVDEMRRAVQEFAQREYPPDAQLLVFVAGHGDYDPIGILDGFLIASDSESLSADPFGKSVLHYGWLSRVLANSKSPHVLLVLDACFGGTFAENIAELGTQRGADDPDVNRDQFIARRLRLKTRQYLTSGGKEYVPDGRPGQHTPFMTRLLGALRTDNDGIVTLNELRAGVQKAVPEPRGGTFFGNANGSDFLFVRAGADLQ